MYQLFTSKSCLNVSIFNIAVMIDCCIAEPLMTLVSQLTCQSVIPLSPSYLPVRHTCILSQLDISNTTLFGGVDRMAAVIILTLDTTVSTSNPVIVCKSSWFNYYLASVYIYICISYEFSQWEFLIERKKYWFHVRD